ncbi:MAG: hypothetical protein AAGD23_06125 [Pseudomonadota bacterium]
MTNTIKNSQCTDDLDALRALIRYSSEEADRLGFVHLAYLLELAAIEARRLPDSSEPIWGEASRPKSVAN